MWLKTENGELHNLVWIERISVHPRVRTTEDGEEQAPVFQVRADRRAQGVNDKSILWGPRGHDLLLAECATQDEADEIVTRIGASLGAGAGSLDLSRPEEPEEPIQESSTSRRF